MTACPPPGPTWRKALAGTATRRLAPGLTRGRAEQAAGDPRDAVLLGGKRYSARWGGGGGDGEGAIADPLTRQPALQAVEVALSPTGIQTTADLGQVALVDPARVLRLEGERLRNADLLFASVREGEGGQQYYEWDLVYAKPNCAYEERALLGVCPYEAVALVAATVYGGGIYCLTVTSDAEQFKKYGPDLRAIRKSFQVAAYSPPPPPPPPADEAGDGEAA